MLAIAVVGNSLLRFLFKTDLGAISFAEIGGRFMRAAEIKVRIS